MIGLNQQEYLFTLLQRKNPDSKFLIGDYENGYPLFKIPLDEHSYKKVLALLFNDKPNEAEIILEQAKPDLSEPGSSSNQT